MAGGRSPTSPRGGRVSGTGRGVSSIRRGHRREGAVVGPREFPRHYWDPQYRRYVHLVEFMATDWRTRIRIDRPRDAALTGELRTVRRLMRRRRARLDDIRRQAGLEFFSYFTTRVMCREASHPRTFDVLWADVTVGAAVAMYYKDLFNRPRPVQYDPSIAPVIETPGHPSYPSGHSTQAHLVALSLAWLVPRARDELWRLAGQIALNREIAGVHFRGDSDAGRSLARQLWPILRRCPAYHQLLVEAQREWR